MNALTGFHWHQLSAPILLLHANRKGRIWYSRCCKKRVEALKTAPESIIGLWQDIPFVISLQEMHFASQDSTIVGNYKIGTSQLHSPPGLKQPSKLNVRRWNASLQTLGLYQIISQPMYTFPTQFRDQVCMDSNPSLSEIYTAELLMVFFICIQYSTDMEEYHFVLHC